MIRRRMTVKRVDPWSVLKLGLVVNIAGAAILVITGMVVWSVIRRLQLIERVCEQAQSLLGFETCTISGVDIMRSGLLLAGLLVVVATGVMVFLAFLYNLIADLTGGIEVSMLDHSGQRGPSTATGGVQLSPELQSSTGSSRPAVPARPGPVMAASTRDQTMSSAAARPPAETPRDDPARPTPTPVAERPGMFERAAAAGAAVKQVADRTGSALSEAGRRATTTLADVTQDEATTRARRSEASRRSLDELASDPLDDTGELPAGERPRRPGDEAAGPRRDDARSGDGRFGQASGNGRPSQAASSSRQEGRRRESSGGTRPESDGSSPSSPSRATSGGGRAPAPDRRTSASATGSGSRGRPPSSDDGDRSPQEAAAARVREQSRRAGQASEASGEKLPPRDADGRFVSREEPRGPQDDLFGDHPLQGD